MSKAQVKYTEKKLGYLSTLDGWRALSIVAVILSHDKVHQLWIFNTSAIHDYGYYGVNVFFAISGLLICSRLLDEERVDGYIHFWRFYVRRFFRILPPAVLYLLVIGLLAKVSVLALSRKEWLEALLFCRNYKNIFGLTRIGEVGWYTEHFWSLSLEEQFYLILPLILFLTAKKYKARVAILVILAAGIAMNRSFLLTSRPWQHIAYHADVRLDALLVPALFAVFASDVKSRQVLKRWLRFWPLLALVTVLLIPIRSEAAWHISLLIILIPCIVLGSVLNPDSVFGRVLEWKWLRFIGRISYSLYLWQQLFFTEKFSPGQVLGPWQDWPLSAILTFACALASYQLLERPMARLGHRWAPSATPGREDLDGTPTPNDKKTQIA